MERGTNEVSLPYMGGGSKTFYSREGGEFDALYHLE